MAPLEFSTPASLAEAIRLLTRSAEPVGVLCGGTDLIIQYRGGRKEIGHMVDIKKIPELNVLEFTPAQGLRLGAAVSCMMLGEFKPAMERYPALVEGAELIGSTQIQSRASVGGNVCNGSPAADSIGGLIVHDAVCVVEGIAGRREVPAREFMTGPGRTALQPGELLVEFRLPTPPPRTSSAYLRFIPRNEMDIAVAGAAACVTLAEDGKTVKAARVAISAVGPTPIVVEGAARALVGRAIDEASLAQAAQAAEAAARPISDVRGPAEYRRHLAGLLTRRALSIAAQRALGKGPAPLGRARIRANGKHG
jgi:carbon-monoxide dehydrogenase medium subunit